jgi:predicted  nucleic acid-binding Zn-ribbon protein
MENLLIISILVMILTIILKVLDTNLDIITANNLKIIEILNKINSINEQLKNSSLNISEDIDDIYRAIKATNNEIMHIKDRIF